MSVKSKLHEIASAADPKKALMEAVGDASSVIDVGHNQVLAVQYVRPKMLAIRGTDAVIHMPDNQTDEDRWQGKVYLVLRCGPLAFVDDGVTKFGGFKIERGDWVIARPADGYEISVADHENKYTPCRFFDDVSIKAKVPFPEMIY